jgi:hypothetical protein
MRQLVLDISSEKDPVLIRELLKRFKGVEVNSFAPKLSPSKAKQRIEEGILQADKGMVKPWSEVKAGLLKRINRNPQLIRDSGS